jgi:hypothetical protein
VIPPPRGSGSTGEDQNSKFAALARAFSFIFSPLFLYHQRNPRAFLRSRLDAMIRRLEIMAIKNETQKLISEESRVVKLLSNALSKKLFNDNRSFLLKKCGHKKMNPQYHTYMGNIFPLTHLPVPL